MKRECTKEYCTLEDFVFEWKDHGNGLHSIVNYKDYIKEAAKAKHWFCNPVRNKQRKKRYEKRQVGKDSGIID